MLVSDRNLRVALPPTALGDMMMDRALGAISTGSTAAEDDIEAINRFGMVLTAHEFRLGANVYFKR